MENQLTIWNGNVKVLPLSEGERSEQEKLQAEGIKKFNSCKFKSEGQSTRKSYLCCGGPATEVTGFECTHKRVLVFPLGSNRCEQCIYFSPE